MKIVIKYADFIFYPLLLSFHLFKRSFMFSAGTVIFFSQSFADIPPPPPGGGGGKL